MQNHDTTNESNVKSDKVDLLHISSADKSSGSICADSNAVTDSVTALQVNCVSLCATPFTIYKITSPQQQSLTPSHQHSTQHSIQQSTNSNTPNHPSLPLQCNLKNKVLERLYQENPIKSSGICYFRSFTSSLPAYMVKIFVST